MGKDTVLCDKCISLKEEIKALQEVIIGIQDKHIAFLKGTLSKIDEIEQIRNINDDLDKIENAN